MPLLLLGKKDLVVWLWFREQFGLRPYDPPPSISKVFTAQLPPPRANQCIYSVVILSHGDKGLQTQQHLQRGSQWMAAGDQVAGRVLVVSAIMVVRVSQISPGLCWTPVCASAPRLATPFLLLLLTELINNLGRVWCSLHMPCSLGLEDEKSSSSTCNTPNSRYPLSNELVGRAQALGFLLVILQLGEMFMEGCLLSVFSLYMGRCFEELPKFTHCAALSQIVSPDEFQALINNECEHDSLILTGWWKSYVLLLPGWGQLLLSFLKERTSE